MQLTKITNKKAALELSVGTIVVIVIAMAMLILGIILVNKIFGGATDSVDSLNDRVKAQITDLFTEEGAKIAIKLGADKLAKIKQGSDNFGIGFGAQTETGEEVNDGSNVNLRYTLELANTGDNCNNFETYIDDLEFSGTPPKTPSSIEFDDVEGPNGYSILFFDIPKGAADCTQKIKIRTYDKDGGQIATSVFRVQIIAGGIF